MLSTPPTQNPPGQRSAMLQLIPACFASRTRKRHSSTLPDYNPSLSPFLVSKSSAGNLQIVVSCLPLCVVRFQCIGSAARFPSRVSILSLCSWRKEYSGEAPSIPMHCEKCGGSYVIFLEPMDNVAYLFTTAAAKFGQIERTNF